MTSSLVCGVPGRGWLEQREFAAHPFLSMGIAWASSQHGSLKIISLLKWRLVFPEIALQEASGSSFKTS